MLEINPFVTSGKHVPLVTKGLTSKFKKHCSITMQKLV